jgi:hypothetical protein
MYLIFGFHLMDSLKRLTLLFEPESSGEIPGSLGLYHGSLTREQRLKFSLRIKEMFRLAPEKRSSLDMTGAACIQAGVSGLQL